MELRRLVGLFIALVFIFSAGCQPELKEEYLKTCMVDRMDLIMDNATTPQKTFEYLYNPATLLPFQIKIFSDNPAFSDQVSVSINGRSISLGNLGIIELDASRRITHLKLNRHLPDAAAGDYFYGYNDKGILEDRFYDDGMQTLQRTIFSNDGNSLTGFEVSYENNTIIKTGQLSYDHTVTLKAKDALLMYGDLFPELAPFLPFLQLGKISIHPISGTSISLANSGTPPNEVLLDFKAVSIHTGKGLESYDALLSNRGGAPLKWKTMIHYTCL